MALTHYGDGKCSCVKCGFDDIRALSLDHINGDGHEHRDEGTGYNLYRLLIYNDYPIGLQTMCYNCQFVKRNENNEHNNIKKPKYNAR
jgi:hypothetical protein